MNVLLAAPEICAPFTEGRKQFVLDVAEALAMAGHRCLLWTTRLPNADVAALPLALEPPSCQNGAAHLSHLLIGLPKALRRAEPDALLHFPYGSFYGLRGRANDFAIWATARISRASGIASSTLLYALDAHRHPAQLARLDRRLVIAGLPRASFSPLELAIDSRHWPSPTPICARPRNILFMAGMWQPTPERLEHVLHVRGLACFLRSGEKLAAADIGGIAACPLFSDAGFRAAVLAHPANTWPSGQLQLKATVPKPEIFNECQLFVFPYQEQLHAFTPSSVVEAMLAATPVLFSDQPFLKRLTTYEPSMATSFAAANADALAEKAIALLTQAPQISAAAQRFAHAHWSIEALAAHLDLLLHKMLRK